jgi:hypothetical protein
MDRLLVFQPVAIASCGQSRFDADYERQRELLNDTAFAEPQWPEPEGYGAYS